MSWRCCCRSLRSISWSSSGVSDVLMLSGPAPSRASPLPQLKCVPPVGASLLAKGPVRAINNPDFSPNHWHHPTLDSAILGFSFLSSATTRQRLQPDSAKPLIQTLRQTPQTPEKIPSETPHSSRGFFLYLSPEAANFSVRLNQGQR
ncbi:hypothetical protein EMIT0347P_20225 [Pseudomonas sp. IT-347P]